jgi:tubulin alpha
MRRELPVPVKLKSKILAGHREGLMGEWASSWEANQAGRSIYRLEPVPTEKVLGKHRSQHRALSSIITQMRTGHISLKHWLFKRGHVDTDVWGCGHGSQTINHVLRECPRFADLRAKIFEESRLTSWPDDLQVILSQPPLTKAAAKYMLLTGLLQQYTEVSHKATE